MISIFTTKGDSFLEKGLTTSLSHGFSTSPEEMLQREEEYGHNRKEDRVPESNKIYEFLLFL